MEELEIVRYARMEGLRMFFNKIDYRTAHFHEEWEILLVVENPLFVRSSQEEFVMEEGDICILNPYNIHELQKKDQPSTFLCMQISPHLLPSVPILKNTVMDGLQAKKYYSKKEMQQLAYQMLSLMELYLDQPPLFELKATAMSAEILASMLSTMPNRQLAAEEMDSLIAKGTRISSFKKFVDRNFRHKIRLSDFAAEEGCSLSYLSAFIKKELNMSFRDYVNQVRFYASLKMILDPSLKMQEICDECGFSDYRYFSAVFKEQTGMSPLEFRKQPIQLAENAVHVHQSIHSLERFFSVAESRSFISKSLQGFHDRIPEMNRLSEKRKAEPAYPLQSA